jgi:uncharacterized protein YkwD
MSRSRGASALGALVATIALLLSPVAVPSAHASYAWEGTSASAMQDYANRLVGQVNKRRANHGLPALRLASCIDNFSASWASWLDTNNSFQHSNIGKLMNRCNLTYASENLAAWAGSTAPSSVVTLWMHSDGHRQNILSRKARRVGVTVFYDRSRSAFYAVMDFGRS